MTERINLQNTPDTSRIHRRTVRFPSGEAELRGTLFLPATADGPVPAVVVAGAWTTVKEQMAGTYARELAGRGFAALAFDFAGWGESGGTPRFCEDPVAKTADLHAAVAFLVERPEVDATRLHGLGICASAGYVAAFAADDERVDRLALVAPWLHDAEIAAAVYGGAEGVQALCALSDEGRIVEAASTTDDSVPMFQAPYYTEADRGLIAAYDNRFNLATWRPWLTYDAQAVAERLRSATLVVASEAMALPAGARGFVLRTEAPVTELWLDDVSQFDFYDRADAVTRAVDAVAEHLR